MTSRRKGVSIIFLSSSRKTLLFLRDDYIHIPYPNCWDLLGGHVEPGESVEEAIAREIYEEIEYEIEKPPLLFRTYEMEDRDEYTFQQAADFDINEMPLHEGQRLQWFSESDIRSMDNTQIAFGFRNILLDFFKEV